MREQCEKEELRRIKEFVEIQNEQREKRQARHDEWVESQENAHQATINAQRQVETKHAEYASRAELANAVNHAGHDVSALATSDPHGFGHPGFETQAHRAFPGYGHPSHLSPS